MLKFVRSETRPLLFLAFFMAIFVTASNFLVQFPITFFGMQEVLTYGAVSYPITFLITDLANRRYGKLTARKIVYLGFALGIALTLFLYSASSSIKASIFHGFKTIGFSQITSAPILKPNLM